MKNKKKTQFSKKQTAVSLCGILIAIIVTMGLSHLNNKELPLEPLEPLENTKQVKTESKNTKQYTTTKTENEIPETLDCKIQISDNINIGDLFSVPKGNIFPTDNGGISLIFTHGLGIPQINVTKTTENTLIKMRVTNRSKTNMTFALKIKDKVENKTNKQDNIIIGPELTRDIEIQLQPCEPSDLSIIMKEKSSETKPKEIYAINF
jgi:hypothetical protein